SRIFTGSLPISSDGKKALSCMWDLQPVLAGVEPSRLQLCRHIRVLVLIDPSRRAVTRAPCAGISVCSADWVSGLIFSAGAARRAARTWRWPGLAWGRLPRAISRDGPCAARGTVASPLRSASPHTPAARERHSAKREAPTRQTQSERRES